MANYFRPRAEDEDIRDRANTSLDAGQAQVEQQADPAADPEADTSLQTRAAQYNLNEGKRQAYEAKVRTAAARRRNQPGAEAWQNVANASGDKSAAQQATRKAAEARRDETVTADASTRLAQNDISRQREEQQLAAAQKREQDQQNATELRKFEAAGGETQVDPTTGEKVKALHPDGAPRFKPGAIEGEKPRQQPTADAALASVPGMGAVMTLGGPIDQTTELVQPMRNDRGGIADVPLEQKTDPKTGEIYSETKDQFGQTQRVNLGQDTKIPRLNQIQTEIDTRAMELQALDVQRAHLEPAWKPVEENYKKAKTALDAPLEFIQENGKWVENTPQRFPADPEKLAKWRQIRESTLQWYNNAAKSYGQQAPAMDNLQKQQQEIKLRHEQAQLQKKRVELDLPEQDGGVAATLTAAETGQLPSEEAATADYLKTLATGMPGFGDAFLTANGQASYQQLPALPDGIDLPKTRPIIPQDDPGKAAMISKAFNGVAAPDQLMLHDDGDGFTRVVRKDPNPKGTNHNSIGNMEIDKATGIPRMVLDPRWAPTDILSQVTFGNTDGIDIYLREPKNFTFNPAKEAEWAASIFDALSRNPDPKANNEIIESMGAGPEQILAKLKGGELSVKRAEALMQNLWGSTLKAEDPSAPGAFDKWLYQQTSKQNRDAWTAATVSRSTADKNAVLQTYMDEWQSRNAWKPGVTLQQRVDFEKKLKLTPRTTEQIAGLADSFAITAIQSVAMLSQLSTPVIAPVNAVLNPGDNTKWAEAVGRATANDTRMIGRTATRYATEEGKQAFAERDTIAELLRSTVMTQDVYPGGRESPEWKAAMDAAIRQATDNADKIHGWNREDGWEITREDLDPATNAHLRKLIDIYALTGNKDYLDSFMAAQLEDHGTRQTAKYQLDLAAGRNKYVAAWVQGTHASLYETATEVASTALTLGTGKVLFGAGKALTASKAAAHMVKLEKAAEAGSRLAKFRLAMHGIKADVLKAGMVPDTLANPATRLGKLGNAASKVGKFAVATGATGALEEGFMGLARPDASVPNILHDAMIGAIMEPLLGGIMSVPTVAIGSAIQQSKVSRNVAKFSDAYNREFNSSEGFVPITPQKAQAAMALFDGVNLNAFAQRLTESAANVKIAVEAAAADTAGPAEIQAMHAAQAAHREVIDSVSESIFSRLEAVQHVDSVQAEDRPLAYAIAKVAAGRADLVTPQERAAAAGALTPQGSPVFATAANGIDILTDEGRAHAMSRFPGVGMLIQTAESERMFQQQMAAVPAAATGQSDPNAAPAAAPDDVADTANIPRVAVTPEQQQQAAQVTAQVIAEIATEAPAIAARLSRGAGTVRVSGGVTASVGADGMPRIQIIEDDIAQSLAAGMTPAQVAARVKDNIVLHETIHTLQFQVAEQQQTAAGVTGDPATLSQDFYRGIHATMAAESPRMLENGRALYAENDDGSAPAWDTLPEWAQAAEVVRMLTEAKLAGRTTDISRLMDGASPGLLQKLAQIVKDMIAAITTGENIPESVKQHVDALTELYNELLNATPSPTNTSSTNPGSNPSQSTPGQTAPGTGAAPQANSNRQPANNGGTQQTPGDNAGAPAATAEQQARVKATEIVRKEFDKALASRPLLKKDADLMTGLREAAIDIVESHQGLPQAEIKDAAARAIGIYLQSPEVSEKLGALYAAQSDKAKAYRAAATARVKEEARRIIGQRMATVRDLIDSIGRITRPTNALELYRTGQTLPPEWNGMLRSSDYAGGGKNAVVRAILGMIYAPDENSGSSPDSIAVGLEREFPDKYQGMTPDMLWTALGEEIRGYVNGADTSALDDPDADTSGMTDDQIQALADRHAKAAIVEKWRGITGKSLLPATAEAYEAEYQSIVAEQGENDFLDEEYQQQAVAAVDARKPATPEAPPKPKAASKPQGSPDASPPVEDDGSIFAAVDLGNEVVTTPTESDQAAAEKWVNSMPGFQGGKRPMAAPVTAAVRAAFSPEKRSSFRTIVDFFGGGGSWGLFHAMVNFDNVNRVVVYERNADRLLKIKLFHEKGNLVAGMLQQKNVQDILANAAAKMRQSATKSGSALAKRIDTSGISDPLLLGLFQAIRDYAENSYAGAKDKAGEQTPEQKIAISIRIVGEQAAEAYRLAEAFRQRGGKVDYRNADSYQAAPESGTDVLSIIDPPYYRTKGYTFEESIPDMASGEVTETVKENTVREDTYRLTRDLIQRSAAAGNAMIYTDSAFWKMEETEKRGKKTITHPPYFGMKEQHRRYYLPEGGRILSDIVDTFDSFGVVAGEIGAGRKEILGIHGHDITTQPGRRTRPQRNARNNEGQGSPDGRNDQPAGRGGNSGQAVPGMAGRTAAEASPLRSESGDPLNPGDEARLGSAPAQPRIRRSIGELESLAKSQEDFRFWFQDFKGFLETYLGPNKEYAPLVSEFLNATSAASTVGSNVQAMMKALREYIETGTFVSSFLPAHRGNLHRAQSGQTLSGPKISEYSDAVFGIETAVPVDRHIAQLLFNTDKPTKSQIAAAKIRVAKVGLRLGWTPRQTMATLWAANIARNGRTPQSYEKYLQKHRYEIKRLLTADREGNQRGLKASRRIAARIEQRRSDERAAGGLPAGDARLGSAPVQADRRPGESGKDYYQRITQAPVVRFEQSRIVHHTTGEKAAEAIAAGQFQTGADLGVAEKRGAVYFADEDVNPGIYARNDEGGSYEGQQARTLPIDIRGLALLNNEYAPDQGYPNHQQYGNNRIRGEFDMLPPGVDGYISFLDDGRIYEVALPAKIANQAREGSRLFSAPAQRMGIFDRWRKPAEPDQQEPATPPAAVEQPAVEQPARKQLRGVNLKRMVSTLGESMYAKNLWHTIGKEVFQNAVDAVKLNGEGGAISYTEKSSEFTMADNGPGMLPNHILDKFLPAFESGKGVGEGGGFGMAKLAFLGGPKQWEMVTRAKTPDGRILQTTLKGSGESYLNFVTDPHEVETGTLEEITLADGLTMKSEYFSEGVSEGMKTGTALRFTGEGYAYPAGRFITEAMQFVPEVSVSKGEIGEPLGKMIQSTGTGTSASNHSWGLVHSVDLPEATVEIIAREGSEQAVSKYMHLPFLNRSILQFSFGISLGQSVLLPKDIAINIKPKVEAGTVDYPFATNRESVTDNVSNAVKDYLRSVGTQAASEMNDRYAKAKDNSPKIAGTRIAMFDAGGKVPSDVMAEIANAPETKEIAMDVQRIQEAIIKTLARKHGPAYGRATFAGLMTGGHAYGVHFGSSTGPSQIYHDAWLTYDLARKEAEALIIEDGGDLMSDTLENQQIIYDAFLAKTAGIALHEALHQEIRSEGEELARGLTFNAGDIVDTVVTLIKTDRSNEHTARLTAHLFLTGQQLQTFENKDEADRVFRSQGGYQGYQLGKQAGDGKRTEKDRGDRTAVSPRDEVREFGGQPLHARLREATAEFKRAFTPLDPRNPFGDWSASTTEPGILTGYRGENGNGQADNNFGSSEGVGLYLAKTRQDTEFFGKARQVNFPKPKNPLVVDQDATGEPIPLLQEDNEAIWDHIWSHKPDPQDSDWIKAHVLAAKQLGMTQENSEGWDTKLPRALTDILLTMGYDAVYVRSGGMQWVNILAKPGQRFNRGTRSAGGTALFSAPTQNPTAQYRYLKDKEAKAGLTPAEQQALIQSEKAMGQSFAIDMDDPALKSRSKGSVSPSFQPQLNLQRQHPVTGQQLALFSAPAQQGAARHAVLEAKHNAGTITPAEREEAQRIVGNAARAAGHDVEAWHGSPDFKGDAFDRKYFGRNTGLSRGGFSFTTDKAAAEGYMKGAVDQSQAMVDSANDVMRELQDRIDGGMEWTGPFDEESAPEFRSDMVDDIEDAAGYMLDLAKTMPSDLAGKLRAASKLNSTDPTPRLIHAFLKNPTRIDVAGKELLQVQNPTDAKSAEPFTGVPLSERFNPQSPSILMSAPAQPVDDAAALDAALKGMDPIYLKVFQASQRTPTPTPQDLAAEFRLPERAIANIIGTARTRIMAHGRTIRPGGLTPARTADGRLKGGMPERANSTTPILAAVDQIQQQEGLPLGKTANEIHTAGYAILQRPDATQHLLDAHLNGIPNEGQIFATAQLLLEAGIKGEQSPALTELALLYRQRGTEQSDAFRARIDIHRTPAERNALIFQELFTSPNKQVQKAWREAKTPEQKAAILQEWNARVKGVKEALKARGLDLQDAMDRLASQRTDAKAAESEASAAHQKLVDALQADVARLKAQLAAATDEAAKSTAQTQVDAAQQKADQAATLDPANTIRLELQKLTKPERAAIEDLRDGGTWESAASNSFLSVIEVKRVFDKFADALDDAGARAILLAEDILLDNQARLNSPAANAMSREDRAREGAAAIRKALGYDRNLIDRRSKGIEPKPKKGTAKKPAVARPEPADMTDAQFQAYLDNPQTWRSLWQAEMIVTGEETSFDQWINKPETRARKTRLTRMSKAPVSTFTGELDMHDPMSVKRAADEWNIHSASLFDKAVSIWRMGILSGIHTGIVNFGGNVAHSQYNLWPRRLMEAGVNNVLSALGLGSNEAATFGELKYMAQAQHKAMARAGTSMVLSWNMDSRIVEEEVLAMGKQWELGTHVGADEFQKVVGGPLGKLLHSISFRHMTAADEMIKAYHSQTEVMAQAYRMAKAEKLTGEAFDQRMDELLEYGSPAWVKAMDSAKWVTFQNQVDPKNPRSLAIFDRAAHALRRMAHTDTGKTKEIPDGKGKMITVPIMKPNVFAFFFPFINTPLNIMKIGIEMSPVGAFFSTVDALRALKIRIENKSISPEQSRIEASELYNRLRLVQDLTNQIIGMGMFYALGSLVKPDDDEELPWITGSTDWKSTSKGDRDLRARVMPAYTLRVPFTDAMLTYQRIEPFGTALGFIIDARIAVNRKGWSDEALGEFMATAINQFNDKTYMKGLSDLMTVWNDPERIGTRLTSSIVTGFVPNLIRQPIREADPYMRDTKPGADVGFVEGVWHNIKYSLAPGYAPIAQDVWGNPIKRHPGQQFGNVHTDVLLRVFDPTNLTVRDQIDPLDLYLFNWNNTAATPKERFNIEPIQKNLQIDRGGKTTTVQLSPEDHAAANRNAGQAARQFLGNDWDASNPQPQQVERVKEVLQKFQKRERDRLRDKYRSALPEE